MKKSKRRPAPPPALSTRELTLRCLALGGAQGGYGFGRYPEGVLASVRYMTVLVAKP